MGDEIEITFRLEGVHKSDAKLVEANFRSSRIAVHLRGEALLHGDLPHAIYPDGSTWTLTDGLLQITLAKVAIGKTWCTLLVPYKYGARWLKDHATAIDKLDI